jgi:glycerol uptake facilitator-like aquaporin
VWPVVVRAQALAPLAIGLSVTLMHFGMIGIDNCSINPGTLSALSNLCPPARCH